MENKKKMMKAEQLSKSARVARDFVLGRFVKIRAAQGFPIDDLSSPLIVMAPTPNSDAHYLKDE